MSVPLLRLQVGHARRRGLRLKGDAGHGDARLLQRLDLARVISQQPHRGKAKLIEDLHGIRIIARVRRQLEPFVGFVGIQPFLIEQPVGVCLCPQAGSPALLVKVDQHPALDSKQFARPLELPPAITFTGVKYLRIHAPGVDPHETPVQHLAVSDRSVRITFFICLKRAEHPHGSRPAVDRNVVRYWLCNH